METVTGKEVVPSTGLSAMQLVAGPTRPPCFTLTMEERSSEDETAGFPAMDSLEVLCRSCHSFVTNGPGDQDGRVLNERAAWRNFAGGNE